MGIVIAAPLILRARRAILPRPIPSEAAPPDMSAAPLSVAIVGAGPAGFYAADAFLRRGTNCRIDVIDRLPTPFGLVRAGVAPDHQSTKNVTRAFDRTLQRPEVRFVGNVELGETVSGAELAELYDAVVLTFGAQTPRTLGIPGEDREGVCDAAGFVNWYNAVPGAPDLSRRVAVEAAVVVGNGNVALDIARLLAKTPDELADGDIDPAAAAAIGAAPLRDVYVVGRRGPLEASFTAPELSEFGRLAAAAPVVSPADLPEDAAPAAESAGKRRNLRILQDYAAASAAAEDRPARVRFLFRASPAEVLGEGGGGRMTGARLERNRVVGGRAVGTGETFAIAAGLLVSAIGYRAADGIAGIPVDRRGTVANVDGRVRPGLYVAGWARRGPTGVIGTNRNDARGVVDRVLADGLAPGKPGRDGLDALLRARGARPVDYAGWRRIDAAETAAARGLPGARPRVKMTRVADMLAAAEA